MGNRHTQTPFFLWNFHQLVRFPLQWHGAEPEIVERNCHGYDSRSAQIPQLRFMLHNRFLFSCTCWHRAKSLQWFLKGLFTWTVHKYADLRCVKWKRNSRAENKEKSQHILFEDDDHHYHHDCRHRRHHHQPTWLHNGEYLRCDMVCWWWCWWWYQVFHYNECTHCILYALMFAQRIYFMSEWKISAQKLATEKILRWRSGYYNAHRLGVLEWNETSARIKVNKIRSTHDECVKLVLGFVCERAIHPEWEGCKANRKERNESFSWHFSHCYVNDNHNTVF